MWTIGVADRLRFPRFPSVMALLGRFGAWHCSAKPRDRKGLAVSALACRVCEEPAAYLVLLLRITAAWIYCCTSTWLMTGVNPRKPALPIGS
jgi:uncharacterized membrane protein YdfJ with MMPL/SSD domain